MSICYVIMQIWEIELPRLNEKLLQNIISSYNYNNVSKYIISIHLVLW